LKKNLILIFLAGIMFTCTAGCTLYIDKWDTTSEQTYTSSSSNVSSDITMSDYSEISEVSSDEVSSEEPDYTEPYFDTSAYQQRYVTGAVSVPVFGKGDGSEDLAQLMSGEMVYYISRNVMGYSLVYSETLGGICYIDSNFLAEDYTEVTTGEKYYIKDDETAVYNSEKQISFMLDRNDTVSLIAKVRDGFWYICDKKGNYGYVDMNCLSTEKVKKNKNSESKNSDVETAASDGDSDSANGNTDSSSPREDRIFGYGDPPQSDYTVYYVAVVKNFLALRTERLYSADNIIGKIYNGEKVYVIDQTDDEYWYVYSETLGMYGYVNRDYLKKSE